MHPVLATVLQRLGLGLATLFAVSVIIFISIEMLPGDFGQAVLGQAALPETVAAFRKSLASINRPISDISIGLQAWYGRSWHLIFRTCGERSG